MSKPNFQDRLAMCELGKVDSIPWELQPESRRQEYRQKVEPLTQLFKDYIKDKKPEKETFVEMGGAGSQQFNDWASGHNDGISEYYDNLKGGLE